MKLEELYHEHEQLLNLGHKIDHSHTVQQEGVNFVAVVTYETNTMTMVEKVPIREKIMHVVTLVLNDPYEEAQPIPWRKRYFTVKFDERFHLQQGDPAKIILHRDSYEGLMKIPAAGNKNYEPDHVVSIERKTEPVYQHDSIFQQTLSNNLSAAESILITAQREQENWEKQVAELEEKLAQAKESLASSNEKVDNVTAHTQALQGYQKSLTSIDELLKSKEMTDQKKGKLLQLQMQRTLRKLQEAAYDREIAALEAEVASTEVTPDGNST